MKLQNPFTIEWMPTGNQQNILFFYELFAGFLVNYTFNIFG